MVSRRSVRRSHGARTCFHSSVGPLVVAIRFGRARATVDEFSRRTERFSADPWTARRTMATREWITAPRRRGRCYVAIILTILVVCTSTSADDGRHRRRPTTRNICQRDPPDIRVDSMPGDHGFRIQILGHAVRYTPGQVYTGAYRPPALCTSCCWQFG